MKLSKTQRNCIRNIRAGDGRVDIWFAIRQVMTCSRELIAMVGESAKEFHTGIHAHLCEHKDEVSFCLQNYKKRPAEFLEEMGILGPNLLTAHNVMLSDHDIALMAERGVKMIHCPRANLSNHGFSKSSPDSGSRCKPWLRLRWRCTFQPGYF